MKRRHGSILILTIWALMVLAFLAVAVGGYVSANIRVAQYLRENGVATSLARAGVEYAISEIMLNPSNFNGMVQEDLTSYENLFLDNASLPGGVFSVYYTFDDTNASTVVTNYGVVREAAKIDIERASPGDYERLENLLAWWGRSAALASAILSNYPSQKTVAPEYLNRYGPYEALPELLLVDGVDGELFQALEPLVTIREFQRRYLPGAEEYERREAYGGVAEGRAVVTGADGTRTVTASRRIAFVFDRVTTNLLYWREH